MMPYSEIDLPLSQAWQKVAIRMFAQMFTNLIEGVYLDPQDVVDSLTRAREDLDLQFVGSPELTQEPGYEVGSSVSTPEFIRPCSVVMVQTTDEYSELQRMALGMLHRLDVPDKLRVFQQIELLYKAKLSRLEARRPIETA
jgi:hypothetical protein